MKIENRQQLLIIVTVAALVLLVADRFVLEPLGGVWTKRSDRIATLRKQIDDGDLLIERELVPEGAVTSTPAHPHRAAPMPDLP